MSSSPLLKTVGLFALLSGTAAARSHHGAISVSNPRSDDVEIFVDGRYVGEVDERESRRFRVSEGRHRVLVLDDGRVVLETEVSTDHRYDARVEVPEAEGRLRLRNESGTTLRITVDGGSTLQLADGDSRTMTVDEGRHAIRATYTQLGDTRTLVKKRVRIDEGERETLTLRPATDARVRVTNTGTVDAELVIDGVSKGNLRALSSRELVVDVGAVHMELRIDGRRVDTETGTVRAYASQSFELEPVVTGALVVRNPLPIAVELMCSRGTVRRLQPGQTTTYDGLERGSYGLVVRRLTGEPIGELSEAIRPGRTAKASVPTPRTGLVAVASEVGLDATIIVDGQRAARLDAGELERLLLPLGVHEISVRDSRGRVLTRAWLEVEPFEEGLLVARDPSVPSRHERPGAHDHDHSHLGYHYLPDADADLRWENVDLWWETETELLVSSPRGF